MRDPERDLQRLGEHRNGLVTFALGVPTKRCDHLLARQPRSLPRCRRRCESWRALFSHLDYQPVSAGLRQVMLAPMSAFLDALTDRPPELSRLARYTIWNGYLYMALGLALFVAPQGMLELQFQVPLRGYEVGLSNALGMTLLIIGWFYIMGGRTGRASFGLATVVDRALVPFLLTWLCARGQVPLLMALPFVILDPVLALGAFLIWRRERIGSASSSQ